MESVLITLPLSLSCCLSVCLCVTPTTEFSAFAPSSSPLLPSPLHSSLLFPPSGHRRYKTRDDYASLDDYARYVKDNIAVGLMVRCCESYEEVPLGDIGRVTKVMLSTWETL